MCQLFSCIITKPKKVFYSEVSDSHEDIIKENNLNDSEKGKLRELFCRIEILPPDGDVFADFSEWKLQVDEKEKPSWFTEKHEKACLIVAKKYIDKYVLISQEVKEIKEGRYYLKDTKIEKMSGSSTVEFMYDSSTVESMYDSSTVKSMYDSSTVKSMYDSSTVKSMYDSSTVKSMTGSSIAIDRINGIIYKPKAKKFKQKNK
jgi:hypothetical protein